ncbi:UNVERIFIED_CONTAM: hypothetical protein K2H54_066510 [Gekko kuhli]
MASVDSFEEEDLDNMLLSEASMEQFLTVLRDGIRRGIEQACLNVIGSVPTLQWAMENEVDDVQVQDEENNKETQSRYVEETQLVSVKETEAIQVKLLHSETKKNERQKASSKERRNKMKRKRPKREVWKDKIGSTVCDNGRKNQRREKAGVKLFVCKDKKCGDLGRQNKRKGEKRLRQGGWQDKAKYITWNIVWWEYGRKNLRAVFDVYKEKSHVDMLRRKSKLQIHRKKFKIYKMVRLYRNCYMKKMKQ